MTDIRDPFTWWSDRADELGDRFIPIVRPFLAAFEAEAADLDLSVTELFNVAAKTQAVLGNHCRRRYAEEYADGDATEAMAKLWRTAAKREQEFFDHRERHDES